MIKRSIIIVLLFLFLAYLELGIVGEEFWLAWNGMEYTEAGERWGVPSGFVYSGNCHWNVFE